MASIAGTSSKTEHYQALVDMGSNGIRFSISDLSPPTTRILPTIYQNRLGVSLYDAQYSTGVKGPIPRDIVQEVVAGLLGFKGTCEDFGVPHDRVRVVATEATREAINSADFIRQIKEVTGWPVEMLAKEEEGRIGAMGVASSFSSLKGLVMDLGGGSVQLTWVLTDNGEVQTSPMGAVSLPYGAAALTRRLNEIRVNGRGTESDFRSEMVTNFRNALHRLEIPSSLNEAASEAGGFTLYLSGGGFRGWGYILMSSGAIQPYPIPTINGFSAPKAAFTATEHIQSLDNSSTFRISSRRASQVPAVSFLVTALATALPSIRHIYFAQGGLREGLLFSSLPSHIRGQHPLVTATSPYAPRSSTALLALLQSGIPFSADSPQLYVMADSAFLTSLIHLLHYHAPLPKDTRAPTALRSTTTGVLASTHGLLHASRATLALALCERWGGELPPSDVDFLARMQEIVGVEQSWWAKYVGSLAAIIGEVHPAGVIREGEERVKFRCRWGSSDKGKDILQVDVGLRERVGIAGVRPGWADELEKVGKKKNWVGGREGCGWKVDVRIRPIEDM
ncbi:MAG: hypothetical protein LQ347_006930 [Umbilicaria vellea]|nr:MAG: hypothetical protein LQ347_006930 [Umbilicaria vellea]